MGKTLIIVELKEIEQYLNNDKMKKFTNLLALIALVSFAFNNYAANKLEITKIISPVVNSDVTMGEFQDYSVEITNNGTIDFTAADTAAIYIGFVSGSQLINLQPVTTFTTATTLSPTGSQEYTFSLKISFTNPGLYGLGFGLYWWKNDTPAQMLFQITAYNFIKSASIDDDYFAINKAYYSGKQIELSLHSTGNHNLGINVYNTSGKNMFSKQITVSGSGIVKESIATGYLPKGIYIVAVNNEGVLFTRKIFVR